MRGVDASGKLNALRSVDPRCYPWGIKPRRGWTYCEIVVSCEECEHRWGYFPDCHSESCQVVPPGWQRVAGPIAGHPRLLLVGRPVEEGRPTNLSWLRQMVREAVSIADEIVFEIERLHQGGVLSGEDPAVVGEVCERLVQACSKLEAACRVIEQVDLNRG